jgi:thymidylate synthase
MMRYDNEYQYLDLLEKILVEGERVEDRTGVGTLSIFGHQMRFNLSEGYFPAVTTKKLAWKSVVSELLWFLEGSTDERRLAELNYGKPREELVGKQTIWTANADNQGVELGHYNDEFIKELGPVYGYQWRNFDYYSVPSGYGVDQIKSVINQIKTNPNSRRIILNAWNPLLEKYMALPPCHVLIQFKVYNNKLSCQLYQRSMDAFLGAPFNLASYSLLTHIIARECGLDVGDFIHTVGDAHIYLNHIEQVREQLSRKPYEPPSLEIDEDFDLMKSLDCGFELDSAKKFRLKNYQHHDKIVAQMAV